MKLLASLLILGIALLLAQPAGAVGFQSITAAGPQGQTLDLSIWYPSNATPRAEPFGPFPQVVAPDGALQGTNLPLIVLSHGTGGGTLNYYGTAIALAEAGFVVVGILHNRDNYRDHSVAFTRANFAGRPREVTAAIDFMTRDWSGHAAIDAARIGLLGHSAGGTTGLIAVGGRFDPAATLAFCRSHPDDWGCRNGRRTATGDDWTGAPPVEERDTRIKAAVLAAPALASSFLPSGLDQVTVPIQLWVSAKDEIVTDAALLETALKPPPEFHLVAGAGHFAYLTPCSTDLMDIAPEICSDPPGFDRAAFLHMFDPSVIAFFRATLH